MSSTPITLDVGHKYYARSSSICMHSIRFLSSSCVMPIPPHKRKRKGEAIGRALRAFLQEVQTHETSLHMAYAVSVLRQLAGLS